MAGVSYISSHSSTAGTASFTFNPTFASAAYGRHILVVFRSIFGSGAQAVSGVTVNGNAANLMYSAIPGTNMPMAIAIGDVPSSATTVSVVVTHPVAAVRCVVSFYMLDDIDVANASYTVTNTVSSGALNGSITATAPYFVVGGVSARLTGLTSTFSVLSHNANISTTNIGLSVGSGSSIVNTFNDTATPSGTTAAAYVLVAMPPNAPPVSLPSVDTDPVTDIAYNAATLNADITDDGGDTIVRRGFVLDTSAISDPGNTDPDTLGITVIDEGGSFSTGVFDLPATGLTPETTYYVRAFAENSAGFSYGNQETFDTEALPPTTTSIYYFDAHTSIGGSTSLWANNANAFNGTLDSTGSDNSTYNSLAPATKTSFYLSGIGTTAPSSGTDIIAVRLRVGAGAIALPFELWGTAFSGSEDLGSADAICGTTPPLPMGDWADLVAPSGGWTWAALQELEIRFWGENDFMGNYTARASIAQIEVTYLVNPEANNERTIELQGLDTSSSEHNFEINAYAQTNSARNIQLGGVGAANNSRDFTVAGQSQTNAARDFAVDVIATGASSRDAEIIGVDKAYSGRGFNVNGYSDINSERDFEVNATGSLTNERGIEAGGISTRAFDANFTLVGNNTDNDVRLFQTQGVDSAASERNIEVGSASLESSELGLEISGVDTSLTTRNFELDGVNTLNSSYVFKVHGANSANNAKAIQVTGTNDQNADRNIEISGIDTFNTNRDIELIGKDEQANARSLQIDVTANVNSPRAIEVVAAGGTYAARNIETTGINTTTTIRGLELIGKEYIDLHREFQLTGIDNTLSAKPFETAGFDFSDSERTVEVAGVQRVIALKEFELRGSDVTDFFRDFELDSVLGSHSSRGFSIVGVNKFEKIYVNIGLDSKPDIDGAAQSIIASSNHEWLQVNGDADGVVVSGQSQKARVSSESAKVGVTSEANSVGMSVGEDRVILDVGSSKINVAQKKIGVKLTSSTIIVSVK